MVLLPNVILHLRFRLQQFEDLGKVFHKANIEFTIWFFNFCIYKGRVFAHILLSDDFVGRKFWFRQIAN